MKLIGLSIIIFLFSTSLYGQTLDDIKKKLGVVSKGERVTGQKDKVKGFKQVVGKYYIVQVKDISREEAEKILRHMDRLMEEFLKLYEYPFGTQKCYITVYGLEKDFRRVAKREKMETAQAFSYKRGISHYAVTYYTSDLYSTLNHEAFHLFIRNVFKRDPSVWFNEGMACFYEVSSFIGNKFVSNRMNKRRLMIVKGAIRSKQWPGLRDLVRFSYKEFHGTNEAIHYAASWSLIYYLKNKNESAFEGFVSDLVLGKSFSTSIRGNYSMKQKELEKEWLRYIEEL